MKGSHMKIRWIPTQNTLLHIILIKKGCFYINISTNISFGSVKKPRYVEVSTIKRNGVSFRT